MLNDFLNDSMLYLEKEKDSLEEFLYQKGTIEAYTILMDFQNEIEKNRAYMDKAL